MLSQATVLVLLAIFQVYTTIDNITLRERDWKRSVYVTHSALSCDVINFDRGDGNAMIGAMATSSTASFHTTTPVSSLTGKCTVIKL